MYLWPSNSTPMYCQQKYMHVHQKSMYQNVHRSIIHNSPKHKPKSFNTKMDTLWYTWILWYYSVNDNELQLTTTIWISLTHITLSKLSQIENKLHDYYIFKVPKQVKQNSSVQRYIHTYIQQIKQTKWLT